MVKRSDMGVRPQADPLPEIIVPGCSDARIYVFGANNRPVHVMEVPATRFKGMPVCIATANKDELGKLQWAVNAYACLWQELARKHGGF